MLTSKWQFSVLHYFTNIKTLLLYKLQTFEPKISKRTSEIVIMHNYINDIM